MEPGLVQNANELPQMNIQRSSENAEERGGNKRHKTKEENIDQETNEEIIQSMWSSLQKNPSNFNRWAYLLRLVVNENNLYTIRKVYTAFLKKFPMCYGYWKKYAEVERKYNNIKEFERVINDGLEAVITSVELWSYLLTYKKTANTDVDNIRDLYEYGVDHCGLDFNSDKFWNDYIQWEIDQNEISKAFKIYCRLISIPTKEYLQNFKNFKLFLSENSIDNIYSIEEFISRRTIILENLTADNGLIDDSILPGEEVASNMEDLENIVLLKLKEDLEQSINEIHKKTTEEFKLREDFEKNIHIPYFNVNKLGALQIDNWNNYIEFEILRGDNQRIAFLFERCLIPCALIKVFWANYLDFLESHRDSFDYTYVSNVFKKACSIYPKSHSFNLRYSDYEDMNGHRENSKKILTNLEKIHPFSIEIANRLICFSRLQNDQKVQNFSFERYLDADLKYGYPKSFISIIAIKYAKLVWKHDNKPDKAISIIKNAINKYNISVNDEPNIYLTLINVTMDIKPINIPEVIREFDKILNSVDIDLQRKVIFTGKKVDYLEKYSRDYELLSRALNEFKDYAKQYQKQMNTNS